MRSSRSESLNGSEVIRRKLRDSRDRTDLWIIMPFKRVLPAINARWHQAFLKVPVAGHGLYSAGRQYSPTGFAENETPQISGNIIIPSTHVV